MKKFMILFAFLTDDGFVERDEEGVEIYHREDVVADTEQDALQKFNKGFNNIAGSLEMIDIYEMEVQNGI